MVKRWCHAASSSNNRAAEHRGGGHPSSRRAPHSQQQQPQHSSSSNSRGRRAPVIRGGRQAASSSSSSTTATSKNPAPSSLQDLGGQWSGAFVQSDPCTCKQTADLNHRASSSRKWSFSFQAVHRLALQAMPESSERAIAFSTASDRSEEHTSELQSPI